MNPIQVIQSFLTGGGDVRQLLLNFMRGNKNQLINNLVNMANMGNSTQVETFARNFCKEKGIDFDTEFNKFMCNFNKR